jgi:hypothetical protein
MVTQYSRREIDHIQLIDFIARPDGFEPPITWFEERFCIGQISINQSLVALAIGEVGLFKSQLRQLRHNQFSAATISKFVASECPPPGDVSGN